MMPIKELAWRIKVALKPIPHQIEGRIEIPFDFLLFKGGLGNVGKPLGIHFGHERFGIKRYLDLVPLLGEQWHIRKLNVAGDFCYCDLNSVTFYLSRHKDIVEPEVVTPGCIFLVFKFVRMDCPPCKWKDILSIL